MKNKFENKKSWQGIAAVVRRKDYKFGPASSPDLWFLFQKYFKVAVAKKRKVNVLVLGATPEFRDLALKNNCNVVALDFSMAMIKKMSLAMKYQNHPNETIVIANWLSSPIKDNFFDLIVGDLVAVNIPKKLQGVFFGELKRMLKKGGHILLKEAYIIPEIGIRKAEEIIELSRREKWDAADLLAFLYFYSDLGCYDAKTNKAKHKILFKKIDKLHKENKLDKTEYEALQKMRSDNTLYVLPKELFLKNFTKYFKLVAIDHAKNFRYFQFIELIFGQK